MMVQGDGGRCWGAGEMIVIVVEVHVQVHTRARGWGLKLQKPSVLAWFWVCHVKWWCKTMGGEGTRVWGK